MDQVLIALVQEVFALNEEFDRRHRLSVPHALQPPATAAQIAALEAHLNAKLPPLYRDFLAFSNGWVGFNGIVHILSVEQQIGGEYARYVHQWKGEQWGHGEQVPVEGIVFAIALHTNQAYIFDTNSADAAGEMEVVEWDDGEHARYKDLVAMLEHVRRIRKAMLKMPRRKS